MKVKWINVDEDEVTTFTVDYLDYHTIQHALQSNPGCLEIVNVFNDVDAPSTPADAAEA